MANEQDPVAVGDPAANGAQLALQAVYLKDCSFEAPQGPRATGEWNPQISLDLNTTSSVLEGDLREILLTVTLSAKQGDRTVFLVEVKQAGAFTMQNLSEEDTRRATGVIGPGVLFPYVRATVSNLVTMGGFPQLLLPPVNFEALFLANQQSAANQAANGSAPN
jgi:preprotein translocase subunit SecB